MTPWLLSDGALNRTRCSDNGSGLVMTNQPAGAVTQGDGTHQSALI